MKNKKGRKWLEMPLFLAAPLAKSRVAQLYILGGSHTHPNSLQQKVEKISQFWYWNIETWYVGSLNTILKIVVIGFI